MSIISLRILFSLYVIAIWLIPDMEVGRTGSFLLAVERLSPLGIMGSPIRGHI